MLASIEHMWSVGRQGLLFLSGLFFFFFQMRSDLIVETSEKTHYRLTD